MAEPKTKPTEADSRTFLESVADERRRRDALAVHEIMRRVTGCEAKMWGPSIVGYGSYHYRYASGHAGTWFLTGLSPRKRSLTLYIMPGFGEYEELMGRLGKHRTGRSCLYVNRLDDVDLFALEELIRLSVAFMREKYGC